MSGVGPSIYVVLARISYALSRFVLHDGTRLTDDDHIRCARVIADCLRDYRGAAPVADAGLTVGEFEVSEYEYPDDACPHGVCFVTPMVETTAVSEQEAVARAIYETDSVPTDFAWAELSEDERVFWYRCAVNALAALVPRQQHVPPTSEGAK